MKPYYEDKSVKIYLGDCRLILPGLEPVNLVLTDPPYSEVTHIGARSTSDGEPKGGHISIDFSPVDADEIRAALSLAEIKRWCISFIDWHHALPLELEPPSGLEFIRLGIWTKLNPMPQLTGDRPSTGWEGIAIFHPPGTKRWNGGAGPAVWSHGTTGFGYFGPSLHPTAKPLGLIKLLLMKFSDSGETILDPWMGSGTTLRAAKDLGRKAIGIEIEERYCEIAAKRLRQEVLDFAPVGKCPECGENIFVTFSEHSLRCGNVRQVKHDRHFS